MSKNLAEVTKIVSKTRPNGEVDFEPMDQDVATKLNGTTVDDGKGNRVKIKDTGKTINEGDEINTGDFITLGKSLNAAVEAALRQHGDEIAYTVPKANMGKTYISIYVHYKDNTEGQEKPSEDKFIFKVDGNTVKLQNGSELIDVCPIVKKAGTLYINRDIAKDAIFEFISNSAENIIDSEGLDEQDSLQHPDKDLLLGFKKAIDNYKTNKSKDTLKELLKASRGFEGDTLPQKFRNAVKTYLSSNIEEPGSDEAIDDDLGTDQNGGVVAVADEPQVVSPQDSRVETEPEECTCVNDEGNICLDMSLFIRLMEYAHEDAKEDVDLHFVAEELQKVCNQKGCASMDDYEQIISKSGTEKEEGDMDESFDEDGNWVDPIEPNEDFDTDPNYLSEINFVDPENL